MTLWLAAPLYAKVARPQLQDWVWNSTVLGCQRILLGGIPGLSQKKSLSKATFNKFYNFAAFWFDFGFVRLWLLVELTQISIMLVLPRWFESLGRWFSHLLGSFPMARTFDNHSGHWLRNVLYIFIWSWVFCVFFMLAPRKIMHFQRFNDISGTSSGNAIYIYYDM